MKTLLVVDDERDVELLFRLNFRRELQHNDLQLFFAFNGDMGLRCYHELHHIHSQIFLISDINMPIMNGIEMIREIKKMNALQDCWVMTAYSNNEHTELARAAGVTMLLNKPVDFTYIRESIFTQSTK